MQGFVETGIGPVPQVATGASGRDRLGAIGARTGLTRNRYQVAPGIYAVGKPGQSSPVLVTANYKLSFDALRFHLGETAAWLLVIDTRGVNVWCAAGKGTFSSEEIIASVDRFRLGELVAHRELIVPQLAATGVSARLVRQRSGFNVLFGPVRTADLAAYFRHGKECSEPMRTVSFTLAERAVLIPVELYLLAKPLLATLVLAFFLSGIGPGFFSPGAALDRGTILLVATLFGIVGGAVLVPLLLPWLPGRQFWIKGLTPGLLMALLACLLLAPRLDPLEILALSLWIPAASSCLAMNFTGSTPFTSPSGVEYEMRRGIPVQLAAVCLALASWLAAPFL